jgi:hypothetical protein
LPRLPKRVIFGSHGPKCRFFLPNSVFAALVTNLRNWGTFCTKIVHLSVSLPPKF